MHYLKFRPALHSDKTCASFEKSCQGESALKQVLKIMWPNSSAFKQISPWDSSLASGFGLC